MNIKKTQLTELEMKFYYCWNHYGERDKIVNAEKNRRVSKIQRNWNMGACGAMQKHSDHKSRVYFAIEWRSKKSSGPWSDRRRMKNPHRRHEKIHERRFRGFWKQSLGDRDEAPFSRIFD